MLCRSCDAAPRDKSEKCDKTRDPQTAEPEVQRDAGAPVDRNKPRARTDPRAKRKRGVEARHDGTCHVPLNLSRPSIHGNVLPPVSHAEQGKDRGENPDVWGERQTEERNDIERTIEHRCITRAAQVRGTPSKRKADNGARRQTQQEQAQVGRGKRETVCKSRDTRGPKPEQGPIKEKH